MYKIKNIIKQKTSYNSKSDKQTIKWHNLEKDETENTTKQLGEFDKTKPQRFNSREYINGLIFGYANVGDRSLDLMSETKDIQMWEIDH